MIVLFLVGIFPLLFAVWNSLHQFILPKVKPQGSILGIWPLFNAPFIWFGNYTALLTDQSFREALLRTLLFLVINLPIQLVLGMAIALLLHKPGNELLKKIDRVALVIPLATTFAVVGLMGRLMFNRDFGVLNYFGASFSVRRWTGWRIQTSPSFRFRSWKTGSGPRFAPSFCFRV